MDLFLCWLQLLLLRCSICTQQALVRRSCSQSHNMCQALHAARCSDTGQHAQAMSLNAVFYAHVHTAGGVDVSDLCAREVAADPAIIEAARNAASYTLNSIIEHPQVGCLQLCLEQLRMQLFPQSSLQPASLASLCTAMYLLCMTSC